MPDDDPDPARGDAETVDPAEAPAPAGPSYRLASALIAEPRGKPRYQLGDELARGGLGRVTAAIDHTLQRRVAIKELHERSEHGLRRFVREGLTTARLQHPAIVPILDAGRWDSGDPYLVMKLLEGQTLAEVLRERETTEARLALLPNLLAVADALGYAHAEGVVHRDVKPSNIMLGTHGETVLLDWGVAHDGAAPEPWVEGTLAGTVRYMSPEQARGEPATPQLDVYSLGVTIAAVLGGGTPFGELDHAAIVERLRAGDAAIPALPPEISADLAAIVAKATAPPAERYAHAGLLAGDLRKYIAGQLVSARRYTRWQLASRLLRRHRLLIAAAAAVIAVGAVAIRSVVRERNQAVARRAEAEARERELVLLQARASLRGDPTATIAWLKQYPASAPRQDEVLALVDEAEGRGVARHVWHPASRPGDVGFSGDGRAVISAHQDGELVRGDVETGGVSRLAALGTSLLFVRSRGAEVLALDQDGGLHTWSAAGIRHDRIAVPSRPTGLFVTGGGDLKVTFVDREATFVPAAAAPRHSAALDAYAFADDENSATVVYAVSPAGELAIFEAAGGSAPGAIDPAPRRLWRFAPRTWVRSSDDGRAYLAIEPAADQTAKIWVGAAAGTPPIEVATTRACAPGEDREQSSEVAGDGRFAVVARCGAVAVYDVAARRPIAIEHPDRVAFFTLAPDARWLALGRGDGVELIDLSTGASRRLAGGSTSSLAGFSPSGDRLFSAGADQGIRLWPLDRRAAGRLGDIATPTRLYVAGAGELAIRQHLGCSIWSTRARGKLASFGVPPAAIRLLDDEPSLWAWDASDDGRRCVFAGIDGSAIVASVDGSTRSLAFDEPLAACVLSPDGALVFCRGEGGAAVTFDLARGTRDVRRSDGAVRDLVRYRGAPVVLVERPAGWRIETFAGRPIAAVPGGSERRSLRASDAGLVIARTGAVDVWTEAGAVLTIAAERGPVEVSRSLAAVGRGQTIELWDLRTRARRAGPGGHAHAVSLLAWSSSPGGGVLASADDETVRLWDPDTGRIRVIYAEHVIAMVWASDSRSLFTTDGRIVQDWPIDMAGGASPAEVRDRLERLTSARIVDGRAVTVP